MSDDKCTDKSVVPEPRPERRPSGGLCADFGRPAVAQSAEVNAYEALMNRAVPVWAEFEAALASSEAPYLSLERDLLDQVDALSLEEKRLFLTGRSSGDGERLAARFARLMDTRLVALQRSAAHTQTGGRPINRVGPERTQRQRRGLRSFDRQAHLFYKKFMLLTSRDPGRLGAWFALSVDQRLVHTLEQSALPGTSRHHWGTDIDLGTVEPEDWTGDGKMAELGRWLEQHAGRFGLSVAYTRDRDSGYVHEPWHMSTPPAQDLLRLYAQTVDLEVDVILAIVEDFATRNLRLPRTHRGYVVDDCTLHSALRRLDLSAYICSVSPALQP